MRASRRWRAVWCSALALGLVAHLQMQARTAAPEPTAVPSSALAMPEDSHNGRDAGSHSSMQMSLSCTATVQSTADRSREPAQHGLSPPHFAEAARRAADAEGSAVTLPACPRSPPRTPISDSSMLLT